MRNPVLTIGVILVLVGVVFMPIAIYQSIYESLFPVGLAMTFVGLVFMIGGFVLPGSIGRSAQKVTIDVGAGVGLAIGCVYGLIFGMVIPVFGIGGVIALGGALGLFLWAFPSLDTKKKSKT